MNEKGHVGRQRQARDVTIGVLPERNWRLRLKAHVFVGH